MATTTRASLEELVRRVIETPGFDVEDQTFRWKITGTQGTPLFISKRPPSNNTLHDVREKLGTIGWADALAEAAAEEDRKQRLANDRERNEAKMRAAVERAAQLEAEEAEARKQRAAHRAEVAKTVGPTTNGLDLPFRQEAVMLDAEMAQFLLDLNEPFRDGVAAGHYHTNRPVNKRRIAKYAGEMLAGRWKLTHQGLAVTKAGELQDGQHRCLSVLEAAKTNPDIAVPMLITYDLPSENMNVIDTNLSRTATDIMALHGETNRLTLASALRLLWLYYSLDPELWRTNVQVSHEQLLEMLDEHPGIRDAVRKSGRHGVRAVTIGSSAATFVYLAEKAYPDPDRMDDFLHGLGTSTGLWEGDPRAALLKFNRNVRSNRRLKTDNITQLIMLLKAWNYWLQGKQLKVMKLVEGEVFPYPIERA